MKIVYSFLALMVCSLALRAATPEENCIKLALRLPATTAPVANYVSVVRSGNLLFLAGHLPRNDAGQVITGKLGRNFDEAAGADAARRIGLALLATLRSELGSLNRVKRIVRVGGFVNSTEDFTRQPAVINGCSDLLVAVFGDSGRHARAAVGVASLPFGAAVEIELTVEIVD